MTPEERDQWRQFAFNELLLDSGNRAAAATVVILDTIAPLQRENARLRQALWDAHEDFDCCEEAQEYQARIRAALTPSAAPGEDK